MSDFPTVATGDSFVIPSDQIHGCVCLEPSTLVDCFTPRRNDFLWDQATECVFLHRRMYG